MIENRRTFRSAGWFDATGKSGVVHRSGMQAQGFGQHVFDGRPVIGICSSWSELAPCNSHLREVAEAVKRGVWQAEGFPLEFPTISLGEQLLRPTSMLLRNLMAMDVEECLRANPIDGVVLLGGCDKTVPAQLMGAASVGLPTIMVTGGPMLNAKFRGQDLGSGTGAWRLLEEQRAGRLSATEVRDAEASFVRSRGHCMTMGTASTMASMSEILGLQLAGAAEIPAPDSRRLTTSEEAGRRIVALVDQDIRLQKIVTRHSFENAIMVNAAIGGSTNAVIHLGALAGRLGIDLRLDDFDRLARQVPVLVNLQPSGKYLMEDFTYAGGLRAVVNELSGLLHPDTQTVNGKTLLENARDAQIWNKDVIRTFDEPFQEAGRGIAVLRGNLCPDGALIKQSAASPHLMQHTGPALVFDSIEAYTAVADDPNLPVTPDTVLVVRNAGPRGYPGMPEIANVPLPRVLLQQGVRDIVRLSDARMSGTAYGTVVLHITPESAIGGPLGLLRTGDIVELDVADRSLSVKLSDAELAKRREKWSPPPEGEGSSRGYLNLYKRHVLQADKGADFDFLVGSGGSGVPRQSV